MGLTTFFADLGPLLCAPLQTQTSRGGPCRVVLIRQFEALSRLRRAADIGARSGSVADLLWAWSRSRACDR